MTSTSICYRIFESALEVTLFREASFYTERELVPLASPPFRVDRYCPNTLQFVRSPRLEPITWPI
jgi:hypothetical protein